MTTKEFDQESIHQYIWKCQLKFPQDTPEKMCARLKEDEDFMSMFGRGTRWLSLQQYVLATFEMIYETSGKFGRDNRRSRYQDDIESHKKNQFRAKLNKKADWASAYDESYWSDVNDLRFLNGCDLSWLNWRDISKISNTTLYHNIIQSQKKWILSVEWSEDKAKKWGWKDWLRCAYALTPYLNTCDPRHGIQVRKLIDPESFPDAECLKSIMNVAVFSKDDRAVRYEVTSSFGSIASKCCIVALEEFRRLFLIGALEAAGCDDGSRVWGLPVVANRDVFPPCEYDIDLILKHAHQDYFSWEHDIHSTALDRATIVILRRAFVLASYDGHNDNLRLIQKDDDICLLAVWRSRWTSSCSFPDLGYPPEMFYPVLGLGPKSWMSVASRAFDVCILSRCRSAYVGVRASLSLSLSLDVGARSVRTSLTSLSLSLIYSPTHPLTGTLITSTYL